MDYSELKNQIVSKINSFENDNIKIAGNVYFNQKKTIERIDKNLAQEFEDNSLYFGIEKVFNDVSNSIYRLIKSKVNVDSKDIRSTTINGNKHWFQSFLVNTKLTLKLIEMGFARKINQYTESGARYGNGVMYSLDGYTEIIELKDFYIDQGAFSVKDSDFIGFKKSLNIIDLQKKKGVWKNVDKTISNLPFYKELLNKKSNKVDVVFMWIDVPERLIDPKGSNDYVKAFVVLAEPKAEKIIDNKIVNFSEVLYVSKWIKDVPFREWRINRFPGRWLGVSPLELIFTHQERMNEISTQARLGMMHASLQVWQTEQELPVKNVNDLDFGSIIVSPTPLNRLANDERALNGHTVERNFYKDGIADLTGTYDAVKGGAFPATTPATNATISDRNSQTLFAYDKQDLFISLEEWLNDEVLDEIIKSFKIGDLESITGDADEVKRIEEIFVKNKVNEIAWGEFFNGKEVDDTRLQEIEQEVKTKRIKERIKDVEIKDNLFKDVKLKLRIIAGDEQIDMQTLMTNTFQLLSTLIANPQALQDPVVKALIYSWAEKAGINLFDLDRAIADRNEMEIDNKANNIANPQDVISPEMQNITQ